MVALISVESVNWDVDIPLSVVDPCDSPPTGSSGEGFCGSLGLDGRDFPSENTLSFGTFSGPILLGSCDIMSSATSSEKLVKSDFLGFFVLIFFSTAGLDSVLED